MFGSVASATVTDVSSPAGSEAAYETLLEKDSWAMPESAEGKVWEWPAPRMKNHKEKPSRATLIFFESSNFFNPTALAV